MLSFLAFLPLIGGYFFVSTLHFTSIHSARADGYRLVIFAFGAGFLLYLISSFLVPAIYILGAKWPALQNIASVLRDFITVSGSRPALSLFRGDVSNFQFLIACVALSLGWPLAAALNACGRIVQPLSREFAVTKSIASRADPLESFLNSALHSGAPILLTLKSRKVYAGTITSEVNPAFEPASIQIEMLKSGHRNDEDQTVVFTTDYEAIDAQIKNQVEIRSIELLNDLKKSGRYDSLNDDALIEDVLDFLEEDGVTETIANQRLVVIPYAEIVSIHQYDDKIYEVHAEQVLKRDASQKSA